MPPFNVQISDFLIRLIMINTVLLISLPTLYSGSQLKPNFTFQPGSTFAASIPFNKGG